MKVVICTPTRFKPHDAYLAALEASCPLLDAAGITHSAVFRVGHPYISYVMADMIHQAMQTDAEAFICIDDDLSWRPGDLLKLIETKGNVVAGTYRFKEEPESYMGAWNRTSANTPLLREEDGAISATMAPSGFLKLDRFTVRKFMQAYPQLVFGEPEKPAVDLFNHGVILPGDGRWWGQDYAFCRRWTDAGGRIWIVPDLGIDHHMWGSGEVFRGNFHQWLLRQPGGSLHVVNQGLMTEKAA